MGNDTRDPEAGSVEWDSNDTTATGAPTFASDSPENETSGSATGEDLTARITALESELHEKHEDLLRERAEVENFKKRMLRDKADALRFANEPLLRDLLPVVDNLERAIAHASSDAVADGLQLVLKGMIEALDRHGVERINALGERFNPELHEAIAQAERPDAEAGTVVEQHQVGYRLHSRLLRPSLVTVNVRNEGSAVESAEGSD